VISVLSVSVIPRLVHLRKSVDLPERIPPQRIGQLGECSGQVSNPPNSIGTAVQRQVVMKRTHEKLSCRASLQNRPCLKINYEDQLQWRNDFDFSPDGPVSSSGC
jgi:hypothetical protein